jgi:hypothetical protein
MSPGDHGVIILHRRPAVPPLMRRTTRQTDRFPGGGVTPRASPVRARPHAPRGAEAARVEK